MKEVISDSNSNDEGIIVIQKESMFDDNLKLTTLS